MNRITTGTPQLRSALADLIEAGLNSGCVAEDPRTFFGLGESGVIQCCGLGMGAISHYGTPAEVNARLSFLFPLREDREDWEKVRPAIANDMGFPSELFDEVNRLHHRERVPARYIVDMLRAEGTRIKGEASQIEGTKDTWSPTAELDISDEPRTVLVTNAGGNNYRW